MFMDFICVNALLLKSGRDRGVSSLEAVRKKWQKQRGRGNKTQTNVICEMLLGKICEHNSKLRKGP